MVCPVTQTGTYHAPRVHTMWRVHSTVDHKLGVERSGRTTDAVHMGNCLVVEVDCMTCSACLVHWDKHGLLQFYLVLIDSYDGNSTRRWRRIYSTPGAALQRHRLCCRTTARGLCRMDPLLCMMGDNTALCHPWRQFAAS
jgi:hypothetical protein